jgi:hypothetical protein
MAVFIILRLVLCHERLRIVHAGCYTSQKPMCDRYDTDILAKAELEGPAKIRGGRTSSAIKKNTNGFIRTFVRKILLSPLKPFHFRNFRRSVVVSPLPLLPGVGRRAAGPGESGSGVCCQGHMTQPETFRHAQDPH